MKRMIDNKEFNTLKNEVSEIETEVNGLIDDTGTSSSKVWSSNKVNTELAQLKGMGVVYSTSATPTNEDNTFIFNKTDFITEPIPSWTSIIGKQVCQIVDSKIKYIYSVVSTSESTITCVLIGEVGGGKQFYQHNIREVLSSGTEMRYEYSCIVINDNPTAFNRGTFKTYLEGKVLPCSGWFTHKNTGYNDGLILTLTATSGTGYYLANLVKFDSGVFTVGTAQQGLSVAGTFSDDVVTL